VLRSKKNYQERSHTISVVEASEWCQTTKPFSEDENPLKEIDGIFLCYDISDKNSYDNIDKTWKVLLEKCKVLDRTSIVIVGCKGDLQHSIDPSLIKLIKPYADDDVVTSSKLGDKVEDALELLVSAVFNRTQANDIEKSKIWKQLVDDGRDVGNSPHSFKLHYFSRPTWCDFCELFIFGVTSAQGYKCKVCKYVAHKRCMPLAPNFCEVDE